MGGRNLGTCGMLETERERESLLICEMGRAEAPAFWEAANRLICGDRLRREFQEGSDQLASSRDGIR